MAKLPTVTSNIPRDLRTFVDRVREALDTGGPDAVITARQLVAAGVATYTGNVLGPAGSVRYSTPPRPQNVEAEGALANIMVTWDKPVYTGHAYAEIWASTQTPEQEASATSPTIGEAELVGMSPGVFFAHNLGAAAKRWYWVRFVNFAGEAGPYQSTEGVVGETSLDPEYVLEVLTEAVTSSHLASTLLGNINTTFSQTSEPTAKADGAALVAGDIWIDISEGQNRMYRYNGDDWVDVQDSGIAQAISSASGAQGTADGKVTTYYLGVAPTNASHELGEGDLWVDTTGENNLYRWSATSQEWVDIQDGGISQAIQAAAGAQSTADGKITSYYQDDEPTNNNGELSEGDLWTDTNDNDSTYRWDADGGDASNGAWVRVGLASFADVTSSITDQVGYCELSITANGSTTKSVSTANTTQTACQAAQADVNKPSNYTYAWKSDGAIAAEVKTVASSVDTNTATIQVQSQSLDGLEAQYTVKIDNNGAVAGFGLASTTTDADQITSEFIVNADRFAIMRGGDDETDAVVPFVVQATEIDVNGETVPAGVYMSDAFIVNGSITRAKIGNAAIDDAKIANLDAGKITTGFLDANRIEAGSIDANMIDSRGLSIKDDDGNIVLSAGSPLASSNVSGLGALASANVYRASTPPTGVSNSGDLWVKPDANGNDEVFIYYGASTPAEVAIDVLRIAVGVAPTLAELNTVVDGYKIADVNKDGIVNTSDSLAFSRIANGTASAEELAHWTNVVQPLLPLVWQPAGSVGAVFESADGTGGNITGQITTDNVSTYIANAAIQTAQIGDAAIQNAQIGDVIQSSNFVSGSLGWKIDKTGAIELNDATFRGALDITGSSGTNRLELTGDTIKVIDSNNVVRVKIGDLS